MVFSPDGQKLLTANDVINSGYGISTMVHLYINGMASPLIIKTVPLIILGHASYMVDGLLIAQMGNIWPWGITAMFRSSMPVQVRRFTNWMWGE